MTCSGFKMLLGTIALEMVNGEETKRRCQIVSVSFMSKMYGQFELRFTYTQIIIYLVVFRFSNDLKNESIFIQYKSRDRTEN